MLTETTIKKIHLDLGRVSVGGDEVDKIDSFVKEMLEVGNVKVMADVADGSSGIIYAYRFFLDKF